VACWCGISCFGTYQVQTFGNLRWSWTILCTESREIPAWQTISKIDTCQSDLTNSSIVAILASVVDTTCRAGRFLSTTSNLLTRSMYCQPRKTFVTIHWTHFTVHSTCITSFSPQKTNNGALLRMGRFKWQHCNINCLLMTSQYHCLQILKGCSKINFLHNVYFWLVIFSKLLILNHFVTYLSNDPRIIMLSSSTAINTSINKEWKNLAMKRKSSLAYLTVDSNSHLKLTRNVGQCPKWWPPCRTQVAPSVQRRSLAMQQRCQDTKPVEICWGAPN